MERWYSSPPGLYTGIFWFLKRPTISRTGFFFLGFLATAFFLIPALVLFSLLFDFVGDGMDFEGETAFADEAPRLTTIFSGGTRRRWLELESEIRTVEFYFKIFCRDLVKIKKWLAC